LNLLPACVFHRLAFQQTTIDVLEMEDDCNRYYPYLLVLEKFDKMHRNN